MDSEFIQAFQRDVLPGEMHHSEFFASLKTMESVVIVDLCRWIVSNLDYDSTLQIIKAAFHELTHLRDVPSLERLEQLREKWRNTYLEEYVYLLALLRNVRDDEKCNCKAYQDSQFNVPPYQDDLEMTGRGSLNHDRYFQTELVYIKCKICGTGWEVEVDHVHHYPHSHWRRK